MPGIGDLSPEKIEPIFLERSFEITVWELGGKNYKFAVPKTQLAYLTKDSKIKQKKDELVIMLKKFAQSDNWFSLHKQKMVGEK